jgi:PAS domain S-box-containing protein
VSQYAHKAWTVREGFFKGAIYAIAQTPDGYLWVSTELGLERFDGIKHVEWQPPKNEHLPGGRIRSLLTARDGRLWVGTEQGLASWKDGKLTNFPELDGAAVLSLLQDHEGTMWAAGTVADRNGRLCAIRSGGAECYGQDGSLGRFLPSLYEDHSGNLWMGSNQGVWRWRPGPPKLFPVPDSVYGLAESDAGELLIATLGGIRRLVNGRVEPYPLRGITQKFFTLRRDREGALWVGTVDSGLLHVRQDRIDRFAHSDGLSGDRIYAVFEDGEGSIWVGTSDGLDRFREVAIPTISAKQGLSNSFVNAVLAGRDGTIWLGTQNGLDRWKNGEVVVYGKSHGLPDAYVSSLFQDIAGRLWVATLRGLAYLEDGRFTPVFGVAVTAIAGDGGGDLWASSLQSLVHLRSGAVVEEIPWSTLGRKDFAFALLPDPAQGGLWFGFRDGGVAYFKDHRIRASYGRADGLGEGIVRGFQRDLDGGLWAATGGGLSQIKNGHVRTLSSRNGLPCDAINWVLEDDDHFFWLYTSCGLLRIARQDLDVWVRDPRKTVQPTIFDSADGVRAISNMVATREPAKSADGKIWFLPGDGVSVIDPRHLPVNKLPPPVHIEQVMADRQVRWQNLWGAVSNLGLPALSRDLQIDYTALSLVAPEKVRFKYKLEGHDHDWIDAGTRRQAFYNDLSPRRYRFRVIASNNSGVWNETGDTLEFSIAPAYYQTNWFRALLAATVLVLMWAAYQLRMRQVQRESRRLRDVIETIPAYVWSALPDGFVDFINRRWLEFSGFSMDQALGWGWADAVHPEDRAQLVDAWRAAIASGEPMEAEARMRSADGEYRWLLFLSVPQRDQSGKIVKWYGKSMDIEDRKRAEQERERLRQLEADLAHTNRVSMMGELAASVAHEVNQPLTGIVSNGSAALRFLAGDTPDLEEVREAVSDIVRDGKRAGDVIARIRALTKRAALPRETLNLNETIREVLAIVGDEAKKRSVVIRTQFADDLSPVFGDRVQLQQVLLNLIINAMDAMSSVEKRQLAITTQNVDKDQVQVTVQDSGTGLDPKMMARIFEPFFTTKSSGMGMGLSISRSIVQNHGGRLWATANDGPGTSFHFNLPNIAERFYARESGNNGAVSKL